jgi:hypothetical protein
MEFMDSTALQLQLIGMPGPESISLTVFAPCNNQAEAFGLLIFSSKIVGKIDGSEKWRILCSNPRKLYQARSLTA